MNTSELYGELLEAIEENISSVAGGLPMAEAGPTFDVLVRDFQALGIFKLFLELDVEAYRHRLLQGTFARRYYLEKSKSESVFDTIFMAASRTEAIFNALAAGDADIAREIAALSPKRWLPDGEYEDDFCYYAFLHAELNPTLHLDRGDLLDRFERALEGDTSPRLDLLRAMFDRDQDAFDGAFDDLVFDYKQSVASSPNWSEPSREARSRIFVEGLAILHLAEEKGFRTASEYELCPAEARHFRSKIAAGDIFRQIQGEFGL